MENNFIPYEQALALKELGFDYPFFGYYTGDKMRLVIKPAIRRDTKLCCKAPLFQQAFEFFRELKLVPSIIYLPDHNGYNFNITIHRDKYYDEFWGLLGDNTSYKEVEIECLKKLIEIANENV